jgi:hypothetical protein
MPTSCQGSATPATWHTEKNFSVMDQGGWGPILSVFLASAIKPGLVGIPLATALKFSFLKTLLISGGAGVTGSVVFAYLSDKLLVLWHRLLDRFFPNRARPKRFSRTTRFLVKVKKYFGITGIAIISPLFLSIPLGSFFAIRFFGDRQKTLVYMSISSIAWTVLLYFFYNGFFDGIVRLIRG